MSYFKKGNEGRIGFDRPIYSKVVWAGRRRYFFDVLSTKGGDKYITITESRKKVNADGSAIYDNPKIFLFKEDFEKYSDALKEMIAYIDENNSVDVVINEEKDEEKNIYLGDHLDFDSL